MNKYINLETAGENKLSGTACALLLPLTLLSNKDNEINKKTFTRIVSWIKDYRTWNKYWKELEDNNILVRLDKNTWMVSPYECYSDEMTHTTLIHKWNEAQDAIN